MLKPDEQIPTTNLIINIADGLDFNYQLRTQ